MTNHTFLEKIERAADYLREKGVEQPSVGLILGSGLGELATEAEEAIAIPYEDIPGFPVSTVEGHAGQLVYGSLSGKKVLAMQGRFHYYEGYSMKDVTFPVRVMKALGVESLIVTNAAGGTNPDFNPGDLMIIKDQINYTGDNPLFGPNESSLGERFVDMTNAFDADYQTLIHEAANELDISMQEGVYFGFSGPTYETPAEIKMVQVLGGDAVGMSTVPEVIVARHAGLRVAGITCITNLAAGMQASLNHEEVVETTTRVKSTFKALVKAVVEKL